MNPAFCFHFGISLGTKSFHPHAFGRRAGTAVGACRITCKSSVYVVECVAHRQGDRKLFFWCVREVGAVCPCAPPTPPPLPR